MEVALVTCEPLSEGRPDEHAVAAELGRHGIAARFPVWDDPGEQWGAFDLVVIRSAWDYSQRRDEFLAWAGAQGTRLRNPPPIVRWNSDKRYLRELAGAGLPVTPTTFVEPGDGTVELSGEVVVKPAVSAGARNTGRFGSAAHDAAAALAGRLLGEGHTVMVQPYLASVDEQGETALVYFAGELSHVLHKRAVLQPDEEAPLSDHPLAPAAVMFDEGLVAAGSASAAEQRAADAVLGYVRERFGAFPLYARVDLLAGQHGEPLLSELELVEPNLYLETAPHAAGRFAQAILAELRSST